MLAVQRVASLRQGRADGGAEGAPRRDGQGRRIHAALLVRLRLQHQGGGQLLCQS